MKKETYEAEEKKEKIKDDADAKRIQQLKDELIFIRDNVVQGNEAHIARINRAVAD